MSCPICGSSNTRPDYGYRGYEKCESCGASYNAYTGEEDLNSRMNREYTE